MKLLDRGAQGPFDVLVDERVPLRRAGITERRLQWFGILVSIVLVLYFSSLLAAVVAIEVLIWSAARGVWRDTAAHTAAVLAAGAVSVYTGFGVFAPVGEGDALYAALFAGYMASSVWIAVGLGSASAVLHTVTDQARNAASVARAMTHRHERAVVIGTDPDGTIVFFSRGAEVLLGHRAEDMRGEAMSSLIPASTLKSLAVDLLKGPGGAPVTPRVAERATFVDLAHVLSVEEEASGPEVEERSRVWELCRADGERRDHLVSITALRGVDAEVSGYLVTSEDVTRQARTHEVMISALLNQKDTAELRDRADRVKRDLVTTVSHELRTPATSIMGYSELLADGTFGELSEDAQDAVERVLSNGQRMLTLVEDLLELSRVQEKRPGRAPAPVNMTEVLRAARDVMEPLARARNQELRCMLPANPVWVAGDASDLERVLLNLLSNGVKFTPDGGRVSLDLMVVGESIRIAVEDTGPGMSPDEQNRLFEPFFRAETATREAIQGTGLGLTIAKSTVLAHHGDLAVASEVGKGTTFTIVLPKLPANEIPTDQDAAV